MKSSESKTYSEYLSQVEPEIRQTYDKIYKTIKDNIPGGFVEMIQYGMPSFVVPYSIYPDGYQCKPKTELPFIALAANKKFISLHNFAITVDAELSEWLNQEYIKIFNKKPDMGKGCIRFKKLNDVPYDLIAKLSQKRNPQQWIELYETHIKRK